MRTRTDTATLSLPLVGPAGTHARCSYWRERNSPGLEEYFGNRHNELMLEGMYLPQRRRPSWFTASAFLDAGSHRGCGLDVINTRCIRALESSRYVSSFEEAGDQDDATPERCYDKKGQVCNKDELGVPPNLLALRDHQSKILVLNMNHGTCSDPELNTKEECDDGGARWLEQPGPELSDRISYANSMAQARLNDVQHEAAQYASAKGYLSDSFHQLQDEATRWQKAYSALTSAYLLWCRPFHDVNMSCEHKFRQAMTWWQAREPLPACEVGVVTPYLRTPRPSGVIGLVSWLHGN